MSFFKTFVSFLGRWTFFFLLNQVRNSFCLNFLMKKLVFKDVWSHCRSFFCSFSDSPWVSDNPILESPKRKNLLIKIIINIHKPPRQHQISSENNKTINPRLISHLESKSEHKLWFNYHKNCDKFEIYWISFDRFSFMIYIDFDTNCFLIKCSTLNFFLLVGGGCL